MLNDIQYIGQTNLNPNDYSIIGGAYMLPTGDGDFELELDINSNLIDVNEKESIIHTISQNVINRKSTCNHCNKSIKYVLIGLHKTDKTLHTFGSTCGTGIDTFTNFNVENAKEKSLIARKKAQKSLQIMTLLESNQGLSEALNITNNKILKELAGSLKKFGTLSEKQISFALSLSEKQKQYDIINKERASISAECPTDRVKKQKFTVISVKEELFNDIYSGSNVIKQKLLLEHESGYRIFGNVVKSLEISQGEILNCSASVTSSPNDKTFGFFKRLSIN